jgi:glycosyltransferase involved in cell wall biosynthesis
MRILVLPRDPNPYQRLLYGEMRRLGVKVAYIGELTPSRTLSLLLLPLEVAAGRITGARVVHIHWVFAFTIPGARRLPFLRRLAYAWFLVWLRTCRLAGMHIVWTAHNVLPHEPVFTDDAAARRALVSASELVFAHSPSALAELAELGAVPRRSAVIRHGPIAAPSAMPMRIPGADDEPRRFLFFGRVQEYKGVEDLLAAFAALPGDVATHLTVAGQCDDAGLRARLSALARGCGRRLVLSLERVPEEKLAQLLAAADVVVLPFRRVTTSGSAIMALSFGRPLIVPDLAALADLPERAVLRYDGKIPSLAAALARMARADRETLAAMSTAAGSYAAGLTWREIAEITTTEMISVAGGMPQAGVRARPAGSS